MLLIFKIYSNSFTFFLFSKFPPILIWIPFESACTVSPVPVTVTVNITVLLVYFYFIRNIRIEHTKMFRSDIQDQSWKNPNYLIGQYHHSTCNSVLWLVELYDVIAPWLSMCPARSQSPQQLQHTRIETFQQTTHKLLIPD